MAGEEIVNVTVEVVENLLMEVGNLALWLQTLGIIIVLWIAFEITFLVLMIKRRKTLKNIQDRLIKIERKLNKLVKEK